MLRLLHIALFFIWLLALHPVSALCQTNAIGTLEGTVLDGETGLPVAGAHAFIGSTLIGTVTNNEGSFELKHVPKGTHSLWISMVGYEPTSREFTMSDSTITDGLTFDLTLEPTVVEMSEVTVTAKRDRRWTKRLNRFKNMFIGETPFAQETTILNPEVLDFDSNWLGTFTAMAQAPLLIENEALGYRVKYVLKEFKREGTTIRYDGDPLFEELTPNSEEEENLWTYNRERAFYGSFHHFLLALLAGKTKEEGFKLKHIPSEEDISHRNLHFRIDPDEIIESGSTGEERLLSFYGLIEITYVHEKESKEYLRWKGESPHKSPSYQKSWIRLTDGPTAIDPNGEIIDPYGVTVYGYYAYERIADEVPKEYRPANDTFNSP